MEEELHEELRMHQALDEFEEQQEAALYAQEGLRQPAFPPPRQFVAPDPVANWMAGLQVNGVNTATVYLIVGHILVTAMYLVSLFKFRLAYIDRPYLSIRLPPFFFSHNYLPDKHIIFSTTSRLYLCKVSIVVTKFLP